MTQGCPQLVGKHQEREPGLCLTQHLAETWRFVGRISGDGGSINRQMAKGMRK